MIPSYNRSSDAVITSNKKSSFGRMPISSPGCCNVGPLNAETENNLNSILQCGVNGIYG